MRDLPRALAFWHQLLAIPVKLRAPGVVVLQTETIVLELIEDASARSSDSPALAWEVPDLAAACNWLEGRGLKFESEIVDLGPLLGCRRTFRDPDGHLLAIVQYT